MRSGLRCPGDLPRSPPSMVADMSDDAASAEDGGHNLARWFILIGLAIIAAAVGRQVAIASSDREFEARLAELDANRNQ